VTAPEIFLAAAAATRPLVADPAVAAAWAAPSALPGMTVGDLTGHLLRALTTLAAALDAEPGPAGPVVDAPGYFLSIDGLAGPGGADLTAPLHVGIRARAADEAAGWPGSVVARWDAAAAELGVRLPAADSRSLVAARGGRPMALTEYAVTRLVELVVHGDDLAASVGLPPPPVGDVAVGLVVDCLVAVALRRHGGPAVVRALARRERDTVEALRVL